MASKYRQNSPLGTTGDGAYAVSKKGTTLPIQFVPMLGSLFGPGGFGGGSGGGTSGSNTQAPPAPAPTTPAFAWQFPQYSQSWAFTPPAPTPYNSPPAFNPKSPTGYAKDMPAPKTSTKNSKTALSPFSLDSLMTKYR